MDKLYSDHERSYRDLQYVYPVISRRSKGLSLGINLSVDKNCNFDCPYCQVDRTVPSHLRFNLDIFKQELVMILDDISSGKIWNLIQFENAKSEQKVFRDIAIAGDGEPSTSPHLLDCMIYLKDISQIYQLPEIVWISNATGLNKRKTIQSLKLLSEMNGTIWAKLDAGTQAYFETISASNYNLDRIQKMIEAVPDSINLKIQSCFMKVEGSPPSPTEIKAYIERLKEISGQRPLAEIQIYTIARKPAQDFVSPLKLREMQQLFIELNNVDLPVQFYAGAAD